LAGMLLGETETVIASGPAACAVPASIQPPITATSNIVVTIDANHLQLRVQRPAVAKNQCRTRAAMLANAGSLAEARNCS
jgi:hypothetical protein